MRVLLMAGLGPEFMHKQPFDGTLLGDTVTPELAATYERLAGRPVDLYKFRIGGPDGLPLLRPGHGRNLPHLSTAALTSILTEAGVEHEAYDLEHFWHRTGVKPSGDFDVVGVSTTFIWDQATMKAVVDFVTDRYPGATLVLGGQYSNYKYREILAAHPEVDYVIRGDAEVALPQLLRALEGKGNAADVPNLATRKADGEIVVTDIQYVDIEAQESPSFDGSHDLIPYESMRGCPFTCKFCSYPAASPKWRYKSAEKILRDWTRYAETNGAAAIRSMDSTFTVPPARFRALLEQLPSLGLAWEAYTRANVITSREIVEQLEQSHCRHLFIGFESMSDVVLKRMNKAVSSKQNERAIEAFRGTTIDLRGSFLVGYPGETPEEYRGTHDFIVNHHHGRFNVHHFVLQDETMPVWQDAQLYDLNVTNPWTWTHAGMDSKTCYKLRNRTLDEARWKNDDAVHDVWQAWHARPLHPGVDMRTCYKIEKMVERLAFAAKDLGEGASTARRVRALVEDLEHAGIDTADPRRAAATV